MHAPVVQSGTGAAAGPLDFVWLELTNRCNLQCVHCYADSGPTTGYRDKLTEADYISLLTQLHDLGCRKVQFIGGEPTLNRSLPKLIEVASLKGFEFIEVYTNLLRLPEELLQVFVRFHVSVATSFYSHRPEVHDRITTQPGSYHRTLRNMKRVLAAGVPLRAGIVIMDENRADVPETWDYLAGLGIQRIGSDQVRGFGRGNDASACEMGELCGSCAGNILSIGPDGVVAPCNMSKQWSVGSVLENSLDTLVHSERLARVRSDIRAAVDARDPAQRACDPQICSPYDVCCPSTQSCAPCAPQSCIPCRPNG